MHGETAAKFCGQCGEQLRQNAKYCVNCGTAVASPETRDALPDTSEDPSAMQVESMERSDNAATSAAVRAPDGSTSRDHSRTHESVQHSISPEPAKRGALRVAKMFGLIVIGLIVWLFLYARYDNYRNRSKADAPFTTGSDGLVTSLAQDFYAQPVMLKVVFAEGAEPTSFFRLVNGVLYACAEEGCESIGRLNPRSIPGGACMTNEPRMIPVPGVAKRVVATVAVCIAGTDLPICEGSESFCADRPDVSIKTGSPFYMTTLVNEAGNLYVTRSRFRAKVLDPSEIAATTASQAGATESQNANASLSDSGPAGCESHRGNQVEALMIINNLKSGNGSQEIAGNFMRSRLNGQGVTDECIQHLAQTYSLGGSSGSGDQSSESVAVASSPGASMSPADTANNNAVVPTKLDNILGGLAKGCNSDDAGITKIIEAYMGKEQQYPPKLVHPEGDKGIAPYLGKAIFSIDKEVGYYGLAIPVTNATLYGMPVSQVYWYRGLENGIDGVEITFPIPPIQVKNNLVNAGIELQQLEGCEEEGFCFKPTFEASEKSSSQTVFKCDTST